MMDMGAWKERRHLPCLDLYGAGIAHCASARRLALREEKLARQWAVMLAWAEAAMEHDEAPDGGGRVVGGFRRWSDG